MPQKKVRLRAIGGGILLPQSRKWEVFNFSFDPLNWVLLWQKALFLLEEISGIRVVLVYRIQEQPHRLLGREVPLGVIARHAREIKSDPLTGYKGLKEAVKVLPPPR